MVPGRQMSAPDATASDSSARREPVRWVRRLAMASMLVFPPFACWIALRAYRSEAAVFVPSRHPVPRSAAVGLPASLLEVSFRSKHGDTLRGWYLPARNRAAIALCHGTGGDRTSLLKEAAFLHERGYGVLLYDSPGHGESTGEVHWSEGENQALEAALGFLATRPDVDAKRLGVYGFSMGGYVAALVAARDPRVRATVLASAPPDAETQTRWEYRAWGLLSQLPALWAVERGGLDLSGPMPIKVIADIAPRPLLVVGGDRDMIVPLHMTNELFAAALEPKELLLMAGAGHGDYDQVEPGRFFSTLASFLERSLDTRESVQTADAPEVAPQ